MTMRDYQVGWVYVLRNDSLKGEPFKIGYTTKTVKERIKELFSTGVPQKFECVYQVLIQKPDSLETYVHKNLSRYRIEENREFFRCEFKIILQYIYVGIQDLKIKKFDEIYNSDQYNFGEEMTAIKKEYHLYAVVKEPGKLNHEHVRFGVTELNQTKIISKLSEIFPRIKFRFDYWEICNDIESTEEAISHVLTKHLGVRSGLENWGAVMDAQSKVDDSYGFLEFKNFHSLEIHKKLNLPSVARGFIEKVIRKAKSIDRQQRKWDDEIRKRSLLDGL